MPVSPIIFGSMAQNGEGTIHSVFQAISRLETQVRDSEISQSRALRSVMRQLDRIVQLMAVMNRYVWLSVVYLINYVVRNPSNLSDPGPRLRDLMMLAFSGQ